MPPTKLVRQTVINDLYEKTRLMARILATPKMEPLIRQSLNITYNRISQLLARDLDGEEWDMHTRPNFEESLKPSRTPYLEQVRLRVSRWVKGVLENQEYCHAMEAYQNQDGQSGRLFRRSLEKFLAERVYKDLQVSPDATLYHGVQADHQVENGNTNGHLNGNVGRNNGNGAPKAHLISPSDYVGKLAGICTNGLQAKPKMENLPHLESSFAVHDPCESYGLAGVRFKLGQEDKVWGLTKNPIEGMQIVKPVLHRDFEIYLKSPDFLDPEILSQGSGDVLSLLDFDRFLNYQTRLEEELRKQGLKYVIIDPAGIEV